MPTMKCSVLVIFHLIGVSFAAAVAPLHLDDELQSHVSTGGDGDGSGTATDADARKRLRQHRIVDPEAFDEVVAEVTVGKQKRAKKSKKKKSKVKQRAAKTKKPTPMPIGIADAATFGPTDKPTDAPTGSPTTSAVPSLSPTNLPTGSPEPPTPPPTAPPTGSPSKSPSRSPTTPTPPPTAPPSKSPSKSPTTKPTSPPTASPTSVPSTSPSRSPTTKPTSPPTAPPSSSPSKSPSTKPTSPPTAPPTSAPTASPSRSPSTPTSTTLVASTGFTCPSGLNCLENSSYGTQDGTRYNIDLSIQVSNTNYADAYVKAVDKLLEIITGDTPSRLRGDIGNPDSCLNALPATVDDLHICGKEEVILNDDGTVDGPGGTIGYAGPLWAKYDSTSDTYLAATGEITIDSADVASFYLDGRLDNVVLHEATHVLGIGTLWEYLNELVDAGGSYTGQNAIDVWTNQWRCSSSAPPVDTGGGHWDEGCMGNEFMTPIVESADVVEPISKLTLASLEDIGYVVDYGAADDYDGRDTTCCSGSLGGLPTGGSRPPLSDAGKAAAIAHGRDVLSSRQRPPAFENDLEDGIVYVGDRAVVVLYVENGKINDVLVTSE